VRFAISAVAAASGLMLLGLAFYGQPAVYLRQAGEQWNALMDRPTADPLTVTEADQPSAGSPDPATNAGRPATADAGRPVVGDDVLAFERAANERAAEERAMRLQQEVARLQQELAARQQAPAASPTPPAPPQAAAPAPKVVAAAPAKSVPAAVPPPVPPTIVVTPQSSEPAASPSAEAFAPTAEAPKPVPPAPAVAAEPMPVPPVVVPAPPAVAVPERRVAAQDAAPPRIERQPDQAKAEPPKHDVAKAAPSGAEASKAEAARAEAARVEAGRVEAGRVEAGRQAALKVASQKAIPAPPPLPQPSPPRQEPDDTQSVLARLRQLSPAAPPVQQADVPPVPEARPRVKSSPLLPRLGAARAALANGQIEEARRLLQQAQLQLVFGPVDGTGEGTANAGKGAMDVARALDALSANDVPLSRRYIEVAVGDLSGTPTSPPIQETARRASGYAPAYPPR
jgi:hypothetical protein